LLFEDIGNAFLANKRKHILFIGPPVPAKGPKILLRILDYSLKHNLNWSFLLISRTQVDNPLLKNRENLEIFHNSGSDREFAAIVGNSYLVLAPYTRETQSAGILMSYMCGTPVVSSNVGGLPEFVKTGETGYLVDVNAPVEKWIEGINYTLDNFQKMSADSRRYFTENFSGKNWKGYINDVLG
jgi:glycosyltransferase involved in cell wall biosynthesis